MSEQQPPEVGGGENQGIPENNWLIEDPEEFKNIENKTLKGQILVVANLNEKMLPKDFYNHKLEKTHDLIQNLIVEEKVTYEEAAPWMGKIEEKIMTNTEVAGKKNKGGNQEKLVGVLAKELNKLPSELARNMGQISPERDLQAYLTAEEKMVPFNIGPGAEPKFFVLYGNKPEELEYQRKLWEARSVLVQAAAIKLGAQKIEDLVNNEMMSIQLNKGRLEQLFKLPGVLPSTSIYTTIIGTKEYLGIARDEEGNLKDVPNVMLKLLGTEQEIQSLNLTTKQKEELLEERDNLITGPDTIWKADQTSIFQIRNAVRFWLRTKGMHLLFSEEEGQKSNKFEIAKIRAKEAEQISWNLIYTSGMIESFNTRDYPRGIGGKVIPPSNFMNLNMWTILHIQERIESKIFTSGDKDDPAKPKEVWGELGTWAHNNYAKGRWKGPNGTINFPKIIRSNIIYDAFREGGKNRAAFYRFFAENGKQILEDPKSINGPGQFTEKMLSKDGGWTKLPDAPFVNYRFDNLRWATTVLSVIKGFKRGEVGLNDLTEAVRMLGLSKAERENLLVIFHKVRPDSPYLEPGVDPSIWPDYKRMILKDEKTFFTEDKSINREPFVV